MNTKTKLIRFVSTLFLVIATLGISTTTVLADQPITYEIGPITDGTTFTDLCAFPITLSSTFTISATDFVDNNGVVTRTIWHFVAQDTFTANGKTLVGVPYRYMFELRWDSEGNITSLLVNGVFEKVPLPNKGIFNPAGRTNMSDNLFGFTLTPDRGNPGNIAGFCEAFSE